MNWKELSVLTEGVCVEAIADLFTRMGSGGVIIEDPQAARKYLKKDKWESNSVSPDFLNHEFVVVKAYFPVAQDVLNQFYEQVERIQETFGVKCTIFMDEVKSEDWEESWKKYYHTFKVGERMVIKPSWEEYLPEDHEIVIDIDPGMAFGTGVHASTRFCLHFIEQQVKGGERIIDAGCGSGILSIGAAKLGAREIKAMDVDEVAVKVAKNNIRLNHLEEVIQVSDGDIVAEIDNLQADMVLANITAEIVEQLIPGTARILPSGGVFIGSGIVEGRWPGVKRQLEDHGFIIREVLQDIDWIGVTAVKS